MVSVTHFRQLFWTLVGIAAFSASSLLQAQENSAPELILRVKPSLCLRYATGEECTLTVEVLWRDDSPSDYCLHSVQDQQPVRCWENLAEAMLEEQRSMSEDLVYWLSRPGEDAQLVVATVEMATVVDDDKRSRSRRRHIWNLI